MTEKLQQAARALLAHWDTPAWKYLKPTGDLMADLREALAEQVHTPYCKQAPMCKTPCGNSDCVEQAEQEPFDMDDHPPHRLCECRKCMEYFTPLPDCDAFAASGKPIAEQTNTQLMEGYRIGLAEMREKCAKVCEEFVLESNPAFDPAQEQCAAAIRAIKFEGDTGFRPVSEMIAEHKQDPKKAAAIEKAKMRKAEQEPVAVVEITYGREPECYVTGNIDDFPEGVFKLYAAPVRTKDLTDDEIHDVFKSLGFSLADPRTEDFSVARAVIAADREKNK